MIIKNTRFAAIPDQIVEVIVAFARAQRKGVQWLDAHTLKVDGALTNFQLAIDVPKQQGLPLPWETPLRAIAEEASAILATLGSNTLITAGDNAPHSVEERVREISAHKARLLICLRVGRLASTHIRGLRAHTPGRGLLRNRRLAEHLLDRVTYRTGLPSRGIPRWPWPAAEVDTLSRKVKIPRAVLECVCITCPADETLLNDMAFQRRCAYGLVEGILNFLGIPESELHPVEDTGSMRNPSTHGPDVSLTGTAELPPGAARPPEAENVLNPALPPGHEPDPRGDFVSGDETISEERPGLVEVDVRAAPLPGGEATPVEVPAPAPTAGESPPPPVKPKSPSTEANLAGKTMPAPLRVGAAAGLKRPAFPLAQVPMGFRGGGPHRGSGRRRLEAEMFGGASMGIPRAMDSFPHGNGAERPDLMIQKPDGSWLSPRASALLQQQQRLAQEDLEKQYSPRLGPDGTIQWPSLPPGFTPVYRSR